MLDVQAIHSILGADGWRAALIGIGIGEGFLRNKHGPCPICGGKDRFRFDNKNQGKWFCNHCGAGDGFKLTMLYLGMDFKSAFKQIINIARLDGSEYRIAQRAAMPFAPTPVERAEPPMRVKDLIRQSCAIENCDPAMIYLQSRLLWPLPRMHRWRAHPSVDYFDQETKQHLGKFPALLAEVRDIQGELVTLHVTYLQPDGQKLSGHEPRKILSGMAGRESCSVQLMTVEGDTMGVGEGIETSLSASLLNDNMPVWPALNTSLLKKFEPPQDINRLIVFADRDVGGLEAAAGLMERLQGRIRVEMRMPRKANCNDWNDELRANDR